MTIATRNTTTSTPRNDNNSMNITIGPDLNQSKSKLDKKEYRQIILSNGLRVVLISDTSALYHQEKYDDYEDECNEYDANEESRKGNVEMDIDDDGDDDDDDYKIDSEMKDNADNSDEEDDDDDDDDDDDGIRKAAAALIVNAGSFHDPPYANGLAHYLEHMLFMGSSKYPIENQYDSFLSKHSGTDNAYTECEYTVYHFDVCQEKFKEALDMLAWFFIDPLMKDDAVERELNSIESEFMLSKNSDECRVQQLFCHECGQQEQTRQKHPFSNFSWGNIQSLKTIPEQQNINMMKELRAFYNTHYYAQNMSLVVIGGYTLDTLQQYVSNSFTGIPALPRMKMRMMMNKQEGGGGEEEEEKANHNYDYENHDDGFYQSMCMKHTNGGTFHQQLQTPIQKFGMPFPNPADTFTKVHRIIPVKDKHTISITWQIPPQSSNWKSKPVDYIAHLLGHEGKGSILSLLKEKLYVNGCFAGVGSGGYENASSHAFFSMTFTMTEFGVSHWVDIVRCVYMYIGMLRYYCHYDSLPMWIYEELKAIQDLSYQYADEETPIDLVETLAESMVAYHALPPERLLDGDSLLFEFDCDAIKNLLDNYMTPMNARVDILSSTFGRAADFEDELVNEDQGENDSEDKGDVNVDRDAVDFSPLEAGRPQVEPHFGTKYWSFCIPKDIIDGWAEVAEAKLPSEAKLSLPPVNPFVPTNFDLKPLPADDSHHPLLFCSLKLCISVGKKKAWFPCTVNKYDETKNRVLLVYEDEDEKWHKLDLSSSDFHKDTVIPNFEGTFDERAIKFKVISVPKDGEGAILKYGDESDWHVEDGIHYPHVPPTLPASRLPQLVHNTKLLKLWHLQDRKFKRPVAELRLLLTCQNANKSPLIRACAELLSILVQDMMTEISYLGQCCELGNSIAATDLGFTVRVHGFDDKLLYLANEVLKGIFSFNVEGEKLPDGIDRFDTCLEILRRKYNNEGMRASSLCSEVRLRCIRPTIWSPHAKAQAITDISIAKFMDVISSLLRSLSIEALYIGNVDINDANAAISLILKAAASSKGIEKKKHPKQEVLIVAPKPEVHHVIVVPTIDPQEPNTAVEVYIQCGKDNIEERVIIDLLVQIMYEPLFDQLRTKEQFGYQVSCGTRWSFGIMGISFKVVTASKSANSVSSRIEEFLTEFRNELINMSKETYMEHVVGLAKNKLEKCNSLEEEAGNLWYEIVESRYDWEVHRNEAYALRSVTKEQLINAFDEWLCPSQDSRRKLVVHAIGTKDGISSSNRPIISPDDVGNAIDTKVRAIHKASGNKTWGKIF